MLTELNRCARSGLQCEGYAPPAARMFEPGKKNERAQSQERTLVLRRSLRTAPSTSPFQIPEEERSFQFFLRKTVDLISIYSQRHFWTTVVPQATHQHAAVKHSVLALSILHESLARTDGLTEDDNGRLFHHYNFAIRALTQSQPTTDVVLITCILFWTVENFNGAGQPSFDHMEAAQKILREFKAKEDHTESPHYTVINRYIEPIIMDGVQHAQARRVEHSTEDTEEPDWTSTTVSQSLPDRLPKSFANLGIAQGHLRTCIRTLLHTLNSEPSAGDTESLVEHLELHLQRWIYVFHSLTAIGTACMRRMLVVHHVNALALLSELKRTLDGELHDDEDPKSSYSWVVTEMEELLAERPKSIPVSPSHELGIIPPLFTAAVRCTDTDVRSRALAILKSMDRQEGCWTDSVAARMAHAISVAQVEHNIGLRLNKISVSGSDWGLSIGGKDPGFDRFLGGSEEELEQFDMVSHSPI